MSCQPAGRVPAERAAISRGLIDGRSHPERETAVVAENQLADGNVGRDQRAAVPGAVHSEGSVEYAKPVGEPEQPSRRAPPIPSSRTCTRSEPSATRAVTWA